MNRFKTSFFVLLAIVVAGAWFLMKYSPNQSFSENLMSALPGSARSATSNPAAPLAVTAAHDSPANDAASQEADATKAVHPIESASLTPAEFRELSEAVMRSLPLKTSVATKVASPEEIEHFSPEFLLEAGRQLGRIAGALAKNPELRGDAEAFYRTCASEKGLLDSVRAVCLSDLDKMGATSSAAADAPPRVQNLAARLSN